MSGRLSVPVRVLVVLVVVAAAALVGAAATPSERLLVVEDAASGEWLASVPVSNGTVVTLTYMHSVEKSTVRDVYVVAGDRLVMTRMDFHDYGWGLPARANVTLSNGSYSFDPAWEGRELYVKPGRIAGHHLAVGDRRFDLVALSNASTVRIHVTSRSALEATIDRFS